MTKKERRDIEALAEMLLDMAVPPEQHGMAACPRCGHLHVPGWAGCVEFHRELINVHMAMREELRVTLERERQEWKGYVSSLQERILYLEDYYGRSGDTHLPDVQETAQGGP